MESKLYLIKEFQRLKESERQSLCWDIRRNLARINYRIHTDAIQTHLIPPELSKAQTNLVYASEADVLNMALFGQTAAQWRAANPGAKGSIRDQATGAQRTCLQKEEWTTKGLPIIRIQNLNKEDALFNYIAGEYSQDILVEPGDLLVSWSGTVGSSFGSHFWNGEPGVLNQHIFKIGLRETIAKRYAFHRLRNITAEIKQSADGVVGLVHITKEKLYEFTLPVLPLAEQQRIVGLLDEACEGLATAKATAEKNLQIARALFESHLQSVFTQRGPGWVEKRLGDVVTRLTYGYVGPTRKIYHWLSSPKNMWDLITTR